MEEERIGLFIDYENLAIGARDDLGIEFDFKPIADALAERGRVVVRRAYADWSSFQKDRQMLADNQVELIEIPQRRGRVRKNAADIKMAVDAIELAFERDYVTAFVICTGDSDFTPLVQKLRELNKRVVGVGLKASTSAMLPPACDEFLFYENLGGVELPQPKRKQAKKAKKPDTVAAEKPQASEDVAALVTTTLAGLQRSTEGTVRSSSLKRALLRKDPTFSEAEHGFRAFGELLRHLASNSIIELIDDGSRGDPAVDFPKSDGVSKDFDLLVEVLGKGDPQPLSGMKDRLRKRQSDFNERRLGYSGFLRYVQAASARGVVNLQWDDESGDYLVSVPE
ncbi:MAG: NYN domain-containing protein [bacterium]|nr:NYN domain-containing protein [bacterium]MCP4966291.1 NYN domain-containing protein [bacterium]